MIFSPPGYIGHEHVMEVVARHLFPDYEEADVQDMAESEQMEAVLKCTHFLRSILYQRKISAFYHDPITDAMFNETISEIHVGFWLKEAADRCLVTGQYDYWEGSTAQIYFPEGAIEGALGEDTKVPSGRVGRPRKIDAVRVAYHKFYPSGRTETGDTWKQVANRISEYLGESVSEDTIQRAVKDV